MNPGYETWARGASLTLAEAEDVSGTRTAGLSRTSWKLCKDPLCLIRTALVESEFRGLKCHKHRSGGWIARACLPCGCHGSAVEEPGSLIVSSSGVSKTDWGCAHPKRLKMASNVLLAPALSAQPKP